MTKLASRLRFSQKKKSSVECNCNRKRTTHSRRPKIGQKNRQWNKVFLGRRQRVERDHFANYSVRKSNLELNPS